MTTSAGSAGTADFERLAYEAGLRALEHQERLVGELRSRTGLLLTAASLAASFLSREAFSGGPQRGLVALALGSFVVTVAASTFVLLPRAEAFVFSPAAARLYEGLRGSRTDLPTVYRTLVYDLGDLWAANDRSLQPLFLALRVGVLALAVEIIVLAGMTADSLY